MPLIRKKVRLGTRLMTDELRSYGGAGRMGYRHETVRHGAREYARGKVYTNTIESFWSQLKRSIDGTHHFVSAKHLQAYVDQFAWLWNRRHARTPLFRQLLLAACA